MIFCYFPSIAKVQDYFVETGINISNLEDEELLSLKVVNYYNDEIKHWKELDSLSDSLGTTVSSSRIYTVEDFLSYCYYRRYKPDTMDKILNPSLTAWEKYVLGLLIDHCNKTKNKP